MSSPITNVIVLCLDGVGAHWLGPYGNTWGETPAWNQLASESLLFEFSYADSPKLSGSCAALWRSLAAVDRRTSLITDDRQVAELPAAESFDERVLYPLPSTSWAAPSLAATHTAQLLSSATDWISETEHPYLLWLHAAALYGPWDAPYSLRQQLADEEDPAPPRFVERPQQSLPKGYDPDELLAFMQAHAGQIAALDWSLDAFLDNLAQSGELERSILIVTSARGYALGEHGEVGGDDELYGELLQTPCLVRFPDGKFASQRSQRIFPAHDLLRLVQAAFAGDEKRLDRLIGLDEPIDDSLCVAVSQLDGPEGGRNAIRTPCWFLTENADREHQLFAKPDDRWEVNEVSSLCAAAVEEMRALVEQYVAAEREGQPFACDLSELMRRGYDA